MKATINAVTETEVNPDTSESMFIYIYPWILLQFVNLMGGEAVVVSLVTTPQSSHYLQYPLCHHIQNLFVKLRINHNSITIGVIY